MDAKQQTFTSESNHDPMTVLLVKGQKEEISC
jgi:hypothetical protein